MIVYCIVCNITGEKYYGSTIVSLDIRLTKHKCKTNSCCSKQIIERGDYDIYTLHEYDTEEEARMKEDWYIDNKECINKQRVRLTDEERKEYVKKSNENYYYNNREKSLETNKKYREINKEKIKGYQKQKIECEFCKFISIKRHLKNHQKSKRCLEYQKMSKEYT